MKKTFTVVVLLSLLVSTSATSSGQKNKGPVTRSYIESSNEKDLMYYQQATAINNLLAKKGVVADVKVIIKTLKAIDRNVAKFFPNGPYTRNDFIALAWLESAFHQHELGSHGEYGLFQIMPSEYEAWKVKGNFFDIDLNTKMGFRVLKGKYDKWQDYKKGLQAYNGVIRLKNGQWSEKYWKAFEKRKIAVDEVLGAK